MPQPVFQSVIDLGLRDVGVANQSRRLFGHFARWSMPAVVASFPFAVGACVLISSTGGGRPIAAAVALAWTMFALALGLAAVKRSPVVVVKVTAEGRNQVTWIVVAAALLLPAFSLLVLRNPLGIVMTAIAAPVAVAAWRGRARVPEVLRTLQSALAPGEVVLGDGVGLAASVTDRRDAIRVVAATDSRVLVAGRLGVVLEVAFTGMDRFAIAWTRGGRAGSLTLLAADSEHAVKSIASANLLSIAQALRAHGVSAEDPAAIDEAQRGWEEALRRTTSRRRLFDRAAMSTKAFDRGLWLLLGLSALVFYVSQLVTKVGPVPMLVTVAGICALSGYVSGTRSSLAYVAPLNLLVAPAFFFADAEGVVLLMLAVSAVGAAALWAGSALRSAPETAHQNRLNALRLTRIAAILLAGVLGLVATASAGGFQLNSLPLALHEATAQKLPLDGRSDLTGGWARITYTPGPGLRELRTDEHWGAGPDDGARWELRSSFTQGDNVVSLSHYVFEPPLDTPAAVATFVAGKDGEHAKVAGFPVRHTTRVVDDRTGYVWQYTDRRGYWHSVAWFPQPVHTVRVECIARHEAAQFKRLCAEAMASLRFRR